MTKAKFICLFFCVCFVLKGNAQIIDTIIFEGLTKSNPEYLKQLIDCHKGRPFMAESIKKDEQILRNLNLFFSVQSNWYQKDNAYTVVFIIEEANYIYPLFLVSGFKNSLKIQAGISNINFKGAQKTIGAWYQYYDRHSFSVYHKVPHHKNIKFGHEIIINKYSTVEPLYFEDVKSNFNFDNYALSVNGIYWFNRDLNIQLGLSPLYERYMQIDTSEIELSQTEYDFFKFRINSSFNFKNVDYRFERKKGIEYQLYAEIIETPKYEKSTFLLGRASVIYHTLVRKKGNFAIRHELGIATNSKSPFSPFVLDGFMNLRGVGNRVARGTGIFFTNIEYRHTIIKNKIFTSQLILFVDSGVLREASKSWTELANINNYRSFSGLGIRLHANKLYKTILRLDYGIELTDTFNGSLSFGIGQFF